MLQHMLLAEALCVHECTSLSIIHATGTDLPVCATEDAQCCSDDYLMSIQMKVRMKLERFIGEEFEEVIDEYQDEVENLIECELQYFLFLHLLSFSPAVFSYTAAKLFCCLYNSQYCHNTSLML